MQTEQCNTRALAATASCKRKRLEILKRKYDIRSAMRQEESKFLEMIKQRTVLIENTKKEKEKKEKEKEKKETMIKQRTALIENNKKEKNIQEKEKGKEEQKNSYRFTVRLLSKSLIHTKSQ